MANISHFTQTVNGVSTTYDIHDANAIPRSGGAVMTGWLLARTVNDSHVTCCGGNSFDNGASVRAHGKDYPDSSYAGTVLIRAQNNSDYFDLFLKPDGTAKWGNKNLAMQENVVPRSGGAVMIGRDLGRIDDTLSLNLYGGSTGNNGGYIILYGASHSWVGGQGLVRLCPTSSSDSKKQMNLLPSGSWNWDGQAVQLVSDQRFKQQITEIDDKLLDAWESVELCQFKYNDAVDTKKDKARLHTGYVVQQIDSACKSHGVDVSEYGLYCHEEYPEETEEVEVEQADGTKVKETKVIREASEHYSLRYTEALIVECAYLRKCIKELRNEIEQLKSSK